MTTKSILIKRDGTSVAGWELFNDSSGRVAFILGSSGANKYYAYSTTILDQNNWNHVVVTYDGSSDVSGFRIYINSTSSAVLNSDNDSSTSIVYSIKAMEVGTVYNKAAQVLFLIVLFSFACRGFEC